MLRPLYCWISHLGALGDSKDNKGISSLNLRHEKVDPAASLQPFLINTQPNHCLHILFDQQLLLQLNMLSLQPFLINTQPNHCFLILYTSNFFNNSHVATKHNQVNESTHLKLFLYMYQLLKCDRVPFNRQKMVNVAHFIHHDQYGQGH